MAAPLRTGRLVAVTAAAGATAAALEAALVAWGRHQWQGVLGPGPSRPDEVVGAVLALAAVLLVAWLGLTTLASLLAHLPGRVGRRLDAWSQGWSPALARRAATVLVGASLGGVLAPGAAAGAPPPLPGPGFIATAPATAAPGSPDGPRDRQLVGPFAAAGARPAVPDAPGPPAATTEAVSEPPAPGWVPSRPVVRPQPAAELVAGPGRRGPAEVVVLRGDTLWSIVARHLGPDATDAEVARAWPLWWAANRSVVGEDPDLILPGQVLTVPRGEAVTR